MKKSGYSIIEFLVYLAVLGLFAHMLAAMSLSWISLVHKVQHEAQQATHTCAALDCLLKDLHNAPSEASLYYCLETTRVIWQGRDGDYGWSFKESKLFRMHGIYHEPEGQWSRSSHACVASHLTSLCIEPHIIQKNQRAHIAYFTLTGNNGALKRVVVPRGDKGCL